METLFKDLLIRLLISSLVSLVIGFLISKLKIFAKRDYRIAFYITYLVLSFVFYYLYVYGLRIRYDIEATISNFIAGYCVLFPLWFYIGTRIGLIEKNRSLKSTDYILGKKIFGGMMIVSGLAEFASLSGMISLPPDSSIELSSIIIFSGLSKLLFGTSLFLYIPKTPAMPIKFFTISEEKGAEIEVPANAIHIRQYSPLNTSDPNKEFQLHKEAEILDVDIASNPKFSNMNKKSTEDNTLAFTINVIYKLFAIITLASSGVWLFYIYTTDDSWSINSYDDESIAKFKYLLFPSFLLALLVLFQKFKWLKTNETQQRINKLKKEIEIRELENKLDKLTNK